MPTTITPKKKWLEPKRVKRGGGSNAKTGMNPSNLPFGHPAIKSGPKKRHPRIPRGLPGTPMGIRLKGYER